MLPTGKLSVIMPAFNEADRVTNNLRHTIKALEELCDNFEVIVVDDGSRDDTCHQASTLLREYPFRVRIVRYEQNRGKGHALVCGVQQARGDYIAFLDADGELQAAQLPEFFHVMRETNADIVVGSKLHRLSRVVNYPPRRRMWSFAYYLLVRLLFGLPIRDTQTGLKLFHQRVLHRVLPKVLVKRFAFDVEMLALARHFGFRIAEAPVDVEFVRSFSRLDFRDAFAVLVDTVAIFYRLHILRYYDRVSTDWLAYSYPVEVLSADTGLISARFPGPAGPANSTQTDLASSG